MFQMPAPSHFKRTTNLILILFFSISIFSSYAAASSQPVANTDLKERIVDRLDKAGWTRKAALSVAQVNQEYFLILSASPDRLDALIQRLERLGRPENLSVMPRIERHPELAALFAAALKPRDIDRAFVSEECVGAYTGMFQLMIDPYEQLALAEALQRYGRTICGLAKKDIPIPAALFVFDHSSRGAEEYGRWLNESLSKALRKNDLEMLDNVVALALYQGSYLRRRMEQSEDFLRNFRKSLWPAFVRLTDCSHLPEGECNTPFDLLASEPRVWDVLMDERGEELLERGGLLAVELLTDSTEGPSFPHDLRTLARESLLEGDDSTISALIRFKDEPLFRKLMQRDDLDSNLRQRVLADLDRLCPAESVQCPDLENRLRKFIDFPLATLREELGPEPSGPLTWLNFYGSFYALKKLAQGRDLDINDAIAFVDDVITVVSLGTGTPVGKFVTQTIVKSTAKSMAKKASERVMKQSAKRLLGRQSVKGLLGRTTNNWIEEAAMNGKLMAAVTKQFLEDSRHFSNLIRKSTDEYLSFEVTKAVQWAFKNSGIGRESMKKLTTLEARVFMRPDARVVIYPTRGRLGSLMKEVVKDVKENAMNEAIEKALDGAGPYFEKWQKQASVWFFESSESSN